MEVDEIASQWQSMGIDNNWWQVMTIDDNRWQSMVIENHNIFVHWLVINFRYQSIYCYRLSVSSIDQVGMLVTFSLFDCSE